VRKKYLFIPTKKVSGGLMKMFTAKERRNLEYVLSKAPEEGDALYLEELHGLIFGLALTPDRIAPGEWMPIVFNYQQPQYDSLSDAGVCQRYLTDAYERMVKDRRLGKLAFPFNYKKLSDDDFTAIEGWVYGLFLAISLRLDAWELAEKYTEKDFENLSEDALELMDAFSTITAIAMPEAMEEAFQEIMKNESIDEESLQASFYSMLPDSVAILQKNAGRIRKKREQDDQSASILRCKKNEKAG
jgi:yecA family protein